MSIVRKIHRRKNLGRKILILSLDHFDLRYWWSIKVEMSRRQLKSQFWYLREFSEWEIKKKVGEIINMWGWEFWQQQYSWTQHSSFLFTTFPIGSEIAVPYQAHLATLCWEAFLTTQTNAHFSCLSNESVSMHSLCYIFFCLQ